jgi:hypothetical protein
MRCRVPQPRDALDKLILAWERNDRHRLEEGLGPTGKAALSALLAEKTWAEFRAQFWPGRSDVAIAALDSTTRPNEIALPADPWPGDRNTAVAIGYRFEAPHPWSEPELAIEGFGTFSTQDPELETRFANRSGADCGTFRVRFVGSQSRLLRGGSTYLVDNPDLGPLLRLIGACATDAK